MQERGRETGEHQGGLQPLEWLDEGARAAWDERKRQSEMERVWVRVGDQSQRDAG